MYNQKIMDRFLSQKNLGEIRNANAIGHAGNATEGDIIKFYFCVDEKGIIVDAKTKIFGCVAAFAVASLVCEKVIGKTIQDAIELDLDEINNELGKIPKEKGNVLLFAKQAIVETINNYFKKLEK